VVNAEDGVLMEKKSTLLDASGNCVKEAATMDVRSLFLTRITAEMAKQVEEKKKALEKSFDLLNEIYGQILESEEDSTMAKKIFEEVTVKFLYKQVTILKWDYENAVVEFTPTPKDAQTFGMSKVVTRAKGLPDGNTEICSELVIL
jgi:hypothetical protein